MGTYKSSYTGAKIDETLKAVIDNKATWDAKQDLLTDDDKQAIADLAEQKHTVLSTTLTAGLTGKTLTNSAITDDSLIYIYTDVWGVQPTDVTQSGNSLTLTFDAQSSDLNIKVEVR